MKRFFRVVAVLVIMMIIVLSWVSGQDGWGGLLSVLVFAAIVLGPQVLTMFFRRRQSASAGDSPPEPDAVVSSEVVVDEVRRDPGVRDGSPAPPARFATQPRPRARSRPTVSQGAPAPIRRHSRRALLGSKRSVQDAVVVATILGRCRAMDPHHPD